MTAPLAPVSPSILIIVPYFGQWPEWINLYMQSCQYNPDINWLFFTDCGQPGIVPDNVKIINTSFDDYKRLISTKLNIDASKVTPYKLCDFRPAYGYIHSNHLSAYDFFGFGDIDVIYGNLRKFLSNEILNKYQLFSTHKTRISGHFSIFKNNETMRKAFLNIPSWKSLFENPEHLSLDESKFTKVFMPHRKHPDWLKTVYGWFNPLWRNNYFHEQYSTILSPIPWFNGNREHPQNWKWKQGHLTNSDDGEKEFMYLHFMNWKSATWLHNEIGSKAAWEDLTELVHFDSSQEIDHWSITPKGFFKK